MNEQQKLSNRQVECKIDNITIPINIDNDNIINFSSNIAVYTEKNKETIEAAVKIKSSELFDTKTVENTFDSYTQFAPFEYQKENVKTMLNVFEGRGCFGDQVGLGKTVEALMTAHAMHECGAIKNALIIATAQTAEQWRIEIDKKFKIGNEPIFRIANEVDGEFITNIDKISDLIKSDNKKIDNSGKLRVYIASSGTIKGKGVYKENDENTSCKNHIERKHEDKENNADIRFIDLCETEYSHFRDRVNGPTEFLLLNGFISSVVNEKSIDEFIEKNGHFVYYDKLKKSLHYDGESDNKLRIYRKSDFHLCLLDTELCKELLYFLLCKLKEYWWSKVEQDINRDIPLTEYDVRLDEKLPYIYNKMLNGDDFSCAAFNEESDIDNDADIEKIYNRLIYKKITTRSTLTEEKWREQEVTKAKIKSFIYALNAIQKNILSNENLIAETENRVETSAGRTKLEPGDVDLLIVDEVHMYVKKTGNGKQDGENNESNTGRSFSGSALSQFLRNVPFKYCVLLSATPIRTGIKDAADLACIAKGDRYGSARAQQEDYYYSVICGVGKDEREHALASMAANGEVNRLNGIINSTFTRLRIYEVTDSLKANRNTEEIRNYIIKLKVGKGAFKALYTQILLQYYIERYIYCKENDWDYNERCVSFESVLNDKENRFEEPLLAAFDAGVMDFLATNTQPLSKKDIKELYSLVDWTRPSKVGKLIRLNNNATIEKGVAYLCKGITGRAIVYAANRDERDAIAANCENKRIINCAENSEKFFTPICCEYDGHGEINEEKLKTDISSALEEVLIVNRNAAVGRNITEANTLILTSMDVDTGIAEPLDIEQWIGRICRTGQKRECQIIIYLRSRYWDDPNLLKYYYNILSDKDGLDLFGDGKAEVGFVAPIVVDYLTMICDKCLKADNKTYTVDKIKTTAKFYGNREDIKKPTFAGFVKLIFDNKLRFNDDLEKNKQSFIGLVRKICAMVAQDANRQNKISEGESK